MGRRTSIGTLLELLVLLLERESVTLTTLTVATGLTPRTVLARIAELTEHGLCERSPRDDEPRWHLGRRLGKHRVLLSTDHAQRLARLLLRLPEGGERDALFAHLDAALTRARASTHGTVLAPHAPTADIALLDTLDHAMSQRYVLRIRLQNNDTAAEKLASISAIALTSPPAITFFNHHTQRPDSALLAHVTSAQRAHSIAFVHTEPEPSESHSVLCDVQDRPVDSLSTTGLDVQTIALPNHATRLRVRGNRDDIVRFILANAPFVSPLDHDINAEVLSRTQALLERPRLR
ncbi:MAG: hypothetical protein Q8Q09_24595 [Deltaproteobacteria bacterium]|nr:hypothetical protein [Deltaproteobacteria bacterium]